MMRARQSGRPCRVAGHGSWCEVSQERAVVTRAQEKRRWLAGEVMGVNDDMRDSGN